MAKESETHKQTKIASSGTEVFSPPEARYMTAWGKTCLMYSTFFAFEILKFPVFGVFTYFTCFHPNFEVPRI